MTFAQALAMYKAGTPVEQIAPEGSDVEWWRTTLRNMAKNEGKKPKRTGVTAGRGPSHPSRRTNYAAQVAARGAAMAELVSRVNGSEIPFDGMAPDSPAEITAADWYGVQNG